MHRLRRSTLRVEQLEARDLLSAGPSPVLSLLPNTADGGIHLFADQLPSSLSGPLMQFIAHHFAGTQKTLKAETDQLRALNPNWVELHYQLATASGPAQYILNDQWGSDWTSVTANESWFLHDPTGQRLHDSQWNWDQNDISNPAWRQYWLDSVIANMRAEGSGGVFADSFTAGLGGWWYDQTDPRFSGTNAANPAAWPNSDTWTQQLGDLINYMEAGLAATPEHFLYVPNIGALVTGWDNTDYSHIDGAMLEGFGEWGGGYLKGDSSDWVLSMNRALPLAGAGKFLILQPTLADALGTPTGQLDREFVIGTYLLLQGDRTFLNVVNPPGDGLLPTYLPEYALNLGPALAPLPADVSAYSWNGVYRRDFQNGIVLVNPGPNTVTLDLGATYQDVTGTGGGGLSAASLDANGNYVGGSLSSAAVRQVTLVPGSAAILLNGNTQPAPTNPPPGSTPPPVTNPQPPASSNPPVSDPQPPASSPPPVVDPQPPAAPVPVVPPPAPVHHRHHKPAHQVVHRAKPAKQKPAPAHRQHTPPTWDPAAPLA